LSRERLEKTTNGSEEEPRIIWWVPGWELAVPVSAEFVGRLKVVLAQADPPRRVVLEPQENGTQRLIIRNMQVGKEEEGTCAKIGCEEKGIERKKKEVGQLGKSSPKSFNCWSS